MTGQAMDWQIVAYVLAAVTAALLGILWQQVSASLERVAEKLAEVSTMVHGHSIRLDNIEGRHHGGQ